MFIVQFLAMIFSIFALSIIQQKIPNEMLGKVMVYTATVSLCAQPLGKYIRLCVRRSFAIPLLGFPYHGACNRPDRPAVEKNFLTNLKIFKIVLEIKGSLKELPVYFTYGQNKQEARYTNNHGKSKEQKDVVGRRNGGSYNCRIDGWP